MISSWIEGLLKYSLILQLNRKSKMQQNINVDQMNDSGKQHTILSGSQWSVIDNATRSGGYLGYWVIHGYVTILNTQRSTAIRCYNSHKLLFRLLSNDCVCISNLENEWHQSFWQLKSLGHVHEVIRIKNKEIINNCKKFNYAIFWGLYLLHVNSLP